MATQEETTYQNLVSQGYTEEEIKLIMELGLFKTDENINERETEYANQLRDPELPQGRRVGQDRLFIAANPLEHLAGLASTGYGIHKQKGIDKRAKELAAEQVRRRIAFLRGGGGGGAPTPAPGYGPPGRPARGASELLENNVARPGPVLNRGPITMSPLASQLRRG